MSIFNGDLVHIWRDLYADVWQEDSGLWYATMYIEGYGSNEAEYEYHSSDFGAVKDKDRLIAILEAEYIDTDE